jgi:hypothetical protein
MGNLTRRLFLRRSPIAVAAAGALVSTAVLAEPVAEAAMPVFVRVGSPSFSASPEIMAAIKEWQCARAEKDAATVEYDAAAARNTKNGVYHPLPVDHPVKSAWIEADDAATRAQWKLLNLLAEIGRAA